MFFKSVEEAKNYFRPLTIDLNQFNFDEKIFNKIKKTTEKLIFEDECSFLLYLSTVMGNKPLNENFFIEILQKVIDFDKQIYINYCEYIKLVCVLPCLKTKKLYHMDFLVYCLNENYLKLSNKIIEWGIYEPNNIIKEVEILKEDNLKNIKKEFTDDDYDKLTENFIGESALITASGFGHLDIVEKLLLNGANPDIIDSNGRTPLIYACAGNNFQIAEKILETGKSIPEKYDISLRSAFYYCVLNHNENFALKLIKEYNIKPLVYPEFTTALIETAKKKFNKLIYELLKINEFTTVEYINKTDDDDYTLLDYAILKKNKELCLKIIDTGNLLTDHQFTENNCTSLFLAIKNNMEDIGLKLIQNRIKNGLYCDINERSKYCKCDDCMKTIFIKNENKDNIIKNNEIVDLTLNNEFVFACKHNMYNLANAIINIPNRRNMCDPYKDKEFSIEYCFQNGWNDIITKLLREPSHFDVAVNILPNKKNIFELIFENDNIDLFELIMYIIFQKMNFYEKKNYEITHEKEKKTFENLISNSFKELLFKMKKTCNKNKNKYNIFNEKIDLILAVLNEANEKMMSLLLNSLESNNQKPSINGNKAKKSKKKNKKNNSKKIIDNSIKTELIEKINNEINYENNNEEVIDVEVINEEIINEEIINEEIIIEDINNEEINNGEIIIENINNEEINNEKVDNKELIEEINNEFNSKLIEEVIKEFNYDLINEVIKEKKLIKKIEYEPYIMKFNINNNKPFNKKNNIHIPFDNKKIQNGYSFCIIEKKKEIEDIKLKTMKDSELYKIMNERYFCTIDYLISNFEKN